MEKLTITTFNGNDYISKKDLLKFLAEISDAVNTFSDRGDPIRAEGANKVISLLLEKIEPPQEHWKPSEEQMKALYCAINDAISLYSDKVSPLYEEVSRTHFDALDSLYNDLKKLM